MTELQKLIAEQKADAEDQKGNTTKNLVRVIGPADTATQFKVVHGQDFHQDWWNEADPEGDYFGQPPVVEQNPVKLESGEEDDC
jgi:hypothetical protein